MINETKKNIAYGMQIRLDGLKKRKAPQEQIDALALKLKELLGEIKNG